MQIDITWEDPAANFAKVRQLLQNSPPPPQSMIVLPEMFATGFSMDTPKVAEPPQGKTEAFLRTLAAEYRALVIGGLPSREPDGGASNQLVAFSSEGNLLVRYRKLHPFSAGGESEHYTAGTEILLFDWSGWKIAPFICYDLRFPEIFRVAAARGAELFVVISSWPNRRVNHWVNLLQARATENQAYFVGVNRAGRDPQFVYPGRTLVADPQGVIVADAGEREGLLHCTLNHEYVASWRNDFPALKDRRADFAPRG